MCYNIFSMASLGFVSRDVCVLWRRGAEGGRVGAEHHRVSALARGCSIVHTHCEALHDVAA